MIRSIPSGNFLVPVLLLSLSQAVLARTEHTLPLVMSASNHVQQGFVRIINHSNRAGTVVIHAVDDSGRRFGPASLSLQAKETVHFNSRDLERGNRTKGLSAGVGSGRGNWRLELETTLDVEPLAYVRTSDGFLTSMHDVATGGGAACSPAGIHVPIFNPASNRSQQSRLRLVNPSGNSVNVTISGRDDEGKTPARLAFDIPAGAARTITAEDLESGAAGLDGRFGDGAGKWQLYVSADRTIHVMSLLQSPNGHLTNLSTTTRKMEATGSLSTSYELQGSALRTDWRGLVTHHRFHVVAVAYGDFDCDGDEDVFTASGDWTANPTPVEMYANDGAGGFSLATGRFIHGEIPELVHPRKALTGDFNGDGRLDVFVAGHGYDQPPWPGEPPVLLLSSENGLQNVGGLRDLVGFHHGAASADADLDGDLDVFMTDHSIGQSVFLENDGRGRFVQDVGAVPADLERKNVYTTEFIDVDEDGYPDLLVAGHEHENAPSAIYWGDGSGAYDASRKTVLPAVAGQGIVVDVDAEDLDGDGDRDVVLSRTGDGTGGVSNYSGYYIQLVFNRGSRRFADETARRIRHGADPDARWIPWIRLVDVNDDGSLDIWTDDSLDNWGLTWLNDGSGRFNKRQP